MILHRMLLSTLVLVSASSIALAQNKNNNALEQLKDVNRSSQGAAGTKNPEASKAKSGKNIDTATPPAVRAGTPSTQSKAERDAAAIKAYTSKPPTGQAEISKIQKKKIEVPSPVTSAPAKVAAPVKPAPAKVAAPVKPAPAKVAAPVNPAPAKVTAPASTAAAKPAPRPVATAPARPATSTFTTSSSSSTTSSSSSSSSSPAKKK